MDQRAIIDKHLERGAQEVEEQQPRLGVAHMLLAVDGEPVSSIDSPARTPVARKPARSALVSRLRLPVGSPGWTRAATKPTKSRASDRATRPRTTSPLVLFAKRSGVSDSNGRHANIGVGYLMQRADA